MAAHVVNATQTIVVEGFDWGPAVTATVIDFGAAVAARTLDARVFRVRDRRQDYVDDAADADGIGIVEHERTVVDAYPSDAHGRRLAGDSRYVTLAMAVGVEDGGCKVWRDSASMNFWSEPYELIVELAGAARLAFADSSPIDALEVATDDLIANRYAPVMDAFATGTFTASDGRALAFAARSPAADGARHPLVVWLHGAGGGGTDVSMAVFDTKCTALVEEPFQTALGGAHVLIPQCDGFWLEYEGMGADGPLGNPGLPSVWKRAVLELIDAHIAAHTDIDPDRVLVGGCSNGGFLTLDLAFERPGFFAAAFPICEAYRDAGITDAMLASIRELPLWFVYTRADVVVDPRLNEDPTLCRLEKAGATDLHASIFDDARIVRGPSAGHVFPDGHEAWVYFFNDQCADAHGTRMWDWLARARRR